MQPEKISDVGGGKVKAFSPQQLQFPQVNHSIRFSVLPPKRKIEFHVAVCSAEPQIEAKIQLASL
jgi:hypothetical protein